MISRRRLLSALGLAGVAAVAARALSAGTRSRSKRSLSLLLAGDVMLGRGIDQIQRHSVDPRLYESYVRSARRYLEIAEEVSGPIPRGVSPEYVWGDAIALMERHAPVARIVNLETAVTCHDQPWRGKGIHYRMHPDNVAILQAAGIDCAVLANNHVIDWQREGLVETLETLRAAGIESVGAGFDLEGAQAPVTLGVQSARVQVFAMAESRSGIPPEWAAQSDQSGLFYLPDLSDESITTALAVIKPKIAADAVRIASVHWGGNWGYEVPAGQRRLAERLIDEGGAHVVHGHSSHHPKGMALHRGRLILFGAGDLINDYEGIGGHQAHRPQLTALYLPTVAVESGQLIELRILPFRLHRFQLKVADSEDARWLMHRIKAHSDGLEFEYQPAEAAIVARPSS